MMVLLGVPLGLMGAVASLLLRGLDLDTYGQIGLVMLIGLTAKNGILIVEFAAEQRRAGATVLEAAMKAARIRLRPILMTSCAMIAGMMPLALGLGNLVLALVVLGVGRDHCVAVRVQVAHQV